MKTCAERIQANMEERIADLEKLFRAFQEGEEERYADELGTFLEYGLCFDYVPPSGKDGGFFRYLLSCGGPQDEFRFLTEDPNDSAPIIEYWLLDWFDGAGVRLTGRDYELLREIWEFFQEVGATSAEYEKASA